MTVQSLGDRLNTECANSKFAPEHLEIAGLLRKAERIFLNAADAALIRKELNDRTWQIESNIDLIEWPDHAVWIEWELPARAVETKQQTGRTGCLISPHPDEVGRISILTAWEDVALGNVNHSYSIAMIDLAEAHAHAYDARHIYSTDPKDSFERLMLLLKVTQPVGFRDELILRHSGDVGIIERAERLGTAEIPFLIALMLARKAVGGLMLDSNEGMSHLLLTPAPERTWAERMSDYLKKAPVEGFFRRVRRRRATLKWHRPAVEVDEVFSDEDPSSQEE